LRQATRYRHVVSPDVRFFTLKDKQETKGENFVAASQTEPDGTPAVKLWSGELFPRGPYRAVFRIKFHSPLRGGPRLIRVDVLKHAHEGLVTLGEKKIVGHGTSTAREDVEEFVIPFDNPVFGGNFEFRVFALDKRTEFTLQEVEVFLDLRQFLQNSLISFLAAWEKVEDRTGRGPVPPSGNR
jgi:hypothetical protein